MRELPAVLFPHVSQVLESRVDLIKLVRDQYVEQGQDPKDSGPIWMVHGTKATQAYAMRYQEIIKEVWTERIETHSLFAAPDENEADELANKAISQIQSNNHPRVLIYVGGQSVADSTKVIAKKLRDAINEKCKDAEDAPGVHFGGIMTALSSDGVFSVTASVRSENGLPMSFDAAAPEFVVGHKLTLLRQPYWMKQSCVADVLSKISSVWDYNYSCRVLRRYHNDFAADLTKSAYDLLLRRPDDETERIDREYLQDPRSIDELFRAVQLCGLSMQLMGSSDTCSGSEHVGQKWLDDYIYFFNETADRESRIQTLSHGAAVLPMTITTLYLQGQAKMAEKVKEVADAIDLPFKARDLHIAPKALRVCLALGVGYRCPRYLTQLLADGKLPEGDPNERLTVLEEIEFEALPHAIKAAMCDSQLARPDDFGELSSAEETALQRVVERSISRTETALNQLQPEIKPEVVEKIRREFTDLIGSMI